MSDDNHERFSSPVLQVFPEEWYAISHAKHFWLKWRLKALMALLKENKVSIDQPLRALEVGCGTGVLRSQLEGATLWTIDGADLNEYALTHRLPSRGRTLLYDICEERPELISKYDILIMFDILEHIENTKPFIRSALRHLKPGGYILVNVPAWTVLFSVYDVMVGHFRRYTKKTLLHELASISDQMVPVELRYWGLSLLPITLIRKAIVARRKNQAEVVNIGFNPPARWINSALLCLMNLETAWLKKPISGTSIMGIFQKQESNY